MRDQFERLLDLYLAPRAKKAPKPLPTSTDKLFNVTLPSPEDLKYVGGSAR